MNSQTVTLVRGVDAPCRGPACEHHSNLCRPEAGRVSLKVRAVTQAEGSRGESFLAGRVPCLAALATFRRLKSLP